MLSAAVGTPVAVWLPVLVPLVGTARVPKPGKGPTPVGPTPALKLYDPLVGVIASCAAITQSATLRSLPLPVMKPGAVIVALVAVAVQFAVALSNGVGPILVNLCICAAARNVSLKVQL